MSVIAMHQLLATFLLSFLLSFPFSHVSALLDARSTVGPNYVDGYEHVGLTGSTEPLPGYKAFVGLQAQVLQIGKGGCLSNGSNFCFGNNINFCPDCGTCCTEKQYCCGKGGVCCGTGCCNSDKVCSKDLKCVPSVTAVTVTSTIYHTNTYVDSSDKTVVVVEVSTSTVLSTVETTISNAATQTNVDWVIATVTPRPTAALRRVQDGRRVYPTKRSFLNSLFLRGLEKLDNGLALHRRNALTTGPPATTATAGPASKITKYITRITTVTNLDVSSATRTTTTYFTTTIFETVTRVLNAQTTILVTSTLTVTAHQPTTQVIYTAADSVLPGNNPTATSSPAPSSSQRLPTSTIAGIAVGTSAAAILILAIIIFCIRRRRLREPSFNIAHPSRRVSDYMDTREPTLPKILPHFAPSAPAHHAVQCELPKAFAYSSPTLGNPNNQGFPHHQRSGSGLSTLIGTPALGQGTKGDRRSGFSIVSGATSELGQSPTQTQTMEVQRSPVPYGGQSYEVDGNSVGSSGGGLEQGRGSPISKLQVHRQGISYYHPFPVPGQPIYGAVGGEEVVGGMSGTDGPLAMLASRTTLGSRTVGTRSVPGSPSIPPTDWKGDQGQQQQQQYQHQQQYGSERREGYGDGGQQHQQKY